MGPLKPARSHTNKEHFLSANIFSAFIFGTISFPFGAILVQGSFWLIAFEALGSFFSERSF
jgi:hypothetical protein